MKKSDFTLLTQEEIDTLVDFLVDKKQEIRNEVLSQQSIDKLIRLIKNNETRRIRLNPVVDRDKKAIVLLQNAGLCENESQTCFLKMRINQETGYVELYAVNQENGKQQKITPDNMANVNFEDSDSEWGYSVIPISFDEVAETFGLKYDKETLDEICSLFAEKNYGDKGARIPSAFLPLSDQLLDNIAE